MANLLSNALFFSVISVAAAAQGAEFELHPSLAVSEEFTDNVFETPANRISDYITRVLPGLVASYKAPALTGDLNYVFDYRHYARKNRGDEVTHSLSANGKLTAVDNLLFLEVSDSYQRVSLDVTRDTTKESLFVNQSDRNVVTASSYLMLHPAQTFMVKAGYRFIDTRYFKTSAVDKNDHVAFADMALELSKRFSLTANYTFIMETADYDDYKQHQALGGFRYEYADKSFVFAQTGNTWTRYDSGQSLNSVVWNAGITHVFDAVTATVTTGVRYNEDPLSNIMKESFVNGSIEKRLNRGSVSVSSQYSEYYLTQIDVLQTKKYGATVRGQYGLTADLNGSLGFTAEKYEQPQVGSFTRRVQVDSGLSYLLAKQLTASLSYVYVNYYSPDILSDNRHVNRAMFEIKKTF